MAKVRVYQLAKELSVQSALILELLDRMGCEVKSDLSVLETSTADDVRTRVTSAIATEKKRLEREREAQQVTEVTTDAEPAVATAAPEQPATDDAAEEAETPVEAPATEPATQAPAPPAAEAPQPLAAAPRPAAKPATPAAPGAPAARPAAPGTPGSPMPAKPAVPGQRQPRVFPARRIPPPSLLQRTRPPAPGAAPGMAARGPGGPVRPGGVQRPGGPPPGPGRGLKKRRKKDRKAERHTPMAPSKPKADLPPVPENIALSEGVTVKELAEKLNRKSKDVIAKLISRGVLATINQPLDPEVAVGVAKDFGSEARILSFEEVAQQESLAGGGPAVAEKSEAEEGLTVVDAPEDLEIRPPVVTVMGHVDHGKTSLLDSIRTTDVVGGEAGGITQHIGAYQVEENGRKITFLDTPGHEAFTLMRARGAKATDIVVLVVAADDGVKPQTLEAIDHAKAADVPLVVAINKIDKPNAQPDRVKQQLADRDLLVEQYGGTTVCCEVSAKERTGLEELLEMILLVADLKELKANPNKGATGVVLEARRDRAKGIVASVLVQEGTLKVGDPFIAGSSYGKVRAMSDDHGNRITAVGPSTPVEVTGYASEPAAGDSFQAVATEAKARQIASFRQEKDRAERQRRSAARSLESLAAQIAAGDVKEMSVLLKADVQGSVEAIQKALADLPTDKVRVNVLRASIGAISQADVLLAAAAANAVIVGFNVRPDKAAAELAKQEDVDLRMYTVIYDLIDEIKQTMVGLLEPTLKENVIGQAEVRQLFKVPKIGFIAGCYVTDGRIARNAEARLLRDNVVVHTGKLGSLRRFKDDSAEVKMGYECGIGLHNYNDLKEGDVIECFEIEKIAAKSL